MSASLSREQLQKVHQYVTHQKRKRLNALVGCPPFDASLIEATRRRGDDDSSSHLLKPSTPQASALFYMLETRVAQIHKNQRADANQPVTTQHRQEQPSEKSLDDILSLDELLQALLMINPLYRTPWDALLTAAASLDRLSFSELVECASSLQDFLNSLWKEPHAAAGVLFQHGKGVHDMPPQPGGQCSSQTRAESELSSQASSSKSSKSGASCPFEMYSKDTAEAQVLQFTESLMHQIVKASIHSKSDNQPSGASSPPEAIARVLSEVLGTVLQFMQNKQSNIGQSKRSGLFDVLVQKVLLETPFEQANDSECLTNSRSLLTWLGIIHANHSVFSSSQLAAMAERIYGYFSMRGSGGDHREHLDGFDGNDTPELLSLFLDMALYADRIDHNNRPKEKKQTFTNGISLWHNVAVYALYRAFSSGPTVFVTAETSLSRSLQRNWDASAIERFIVRLPRILNLQDEESRKEQDADALQIPQSFSWNILLPFFEVLLENKCSSNAWGLSQALLQDMFGEWETPAPEGNGVRVSKDVFEVLLGCGFGMKGDTGEFGQTLANNLNECRYHGNGSFMLSDKDIEIESLSYFGRAAVSMLFLGDEMSLNEGAQKGALDRALRMIRILETKCLDSSEEQEFLRLVLQIVFKAISYIEIPKFRDSLVQQIRTSCVKFEGEVNNQLKNEFATIEFIVTLVQDHTRNNGNDDTIFMPLCELLDDDDIPPQCFRHLSALFMKVQEARSTILNGSKRMLAPLYFHVQQEECIEIYKDEAGQENPAVLYRTESGIQGLLHSMRNECWDDIHINAWGILSEALVHDIPFLCFEIRQELYQTIADYVSEGDFGDRTQEHVLRALVVRMSHILQTPQNGLQSRELAAVHRTISTLLWCMASGNQTLGHRLASLAHGRDVFLRSLLAMREGRSGPWDYVMEYAKSRVTDSDSSKNDSFTLCWAVFLVLNLEILDTLRERGTRALPSLEMQSVRKSVGMDDLIKRLKAVEREELVVRSGGNAKDSWSLSWTEQSEKSVHRREEGTPKTLPDEQTKRSASISLLFETLCLAPLPTGLSQEIEDTLAWKMISAIAYLLRQQKHGETEADNAVSEIVLDSITVEKIGRAFLSLAALLAREIIRQDCSLSLADELFYVIEAYCHVLEVVLQDFEEHDCTEILLSLWDLYNAIASEKAALKVVNFLDSHLMDDPKDFQANDGSDFVVLNPLESRSDVNRTTRSLRLCCLNALRKAIFSSSIAENIDEDGTITDFLAGMLEALADDLQRGLDGKSGGINSRMYMSYCSLIHDCAKRVFEHYKSKSLDPSVLSLFDKVSCIVAGILIEYPLGSAEKFKSTFILGLVTLPSMCRCLQQAAIVIQTPDAFSIELMCREGSELMDRTFDDCIAILSRWAQTRDPLSIPWEDMAGRQHIKSANNSETSIVSLGSHDNNDTRPRNNKMAPQQIRLIDKEVWSWALSSAIFGLKQPWLDSHGAICGTSEGMNHSIVPNSSKWRLFYQQRRNQLHDTLSKTVRFFQASADAQDQVALDMMAMNMPSYPRDWLCSVIACISQVLTDACLHVHGYLKNTAADKQGLTLPMLESLCCVAAWLSVDSSDSKKSSSRISEFSVGVFRWLEMASRKRPPHETSSARRTESKLCHEKVSSVAEYIYRLYLALKDVERALRKCKLDSEFQKMIKIFLLPEDGGSVPPNNHSVELLPKVSLKLRLILKALPRDFRERSLPDFPVIRNLAVSMKKGSIASGRAAAGQKRGLPGHGKQTWNSRLSSLTSFKRHRTSKMVPLQRISRNPALEAMWALDREADHLQDGRETEAGVQSKRGKRGRYSLYAAAADLEDFIAPG